MASFDAVCSVLREKYEILECKGINHGNQLLLSNNVKVNVYSKSGKYTVQGSPDIKQEVEEFLRERLSSGSLPLETPHIKNNKVFVVYGHDHASRDQLQLFLQKIDFEPLILDQLPSGGATIIEKLETNINSAKFGIVLITPDDIGYRKDHKEEAMGRARQNVVLELGMLLSKLGRDKVFIFMKNQEMTEKPSDISGLIYMNFKEQVKEIGPQFAAEIEKFGYNIPASKLL